MGSGGREARKAASNSPWREIWNQPSAYQPARNRKQSIEHFVCVKHFVCAHRPVLCLAVTRKFTPDGPKGLCLPWCCDIHNTLQKQHKGEGIYLAHSSGKTRWQELERTGRVTPSQGQRTEN